jgi:beta-lactamase class A
MEKHSSGSFNSYYYSTSGQNQQSDQQPEPKKSKKGRRLFTLLLVVIFAAVVYSILGNSNTVKSSDHSIASVVKHTPSNSSKSLNTNSLQLDQMGQTINGIISQNSGIQMSVNLINLNDNQAEHYGTNQTFQAASTAKILTAAYFLHEVENGQQSLSETINGSSAEYELQQMIVVSDDNAWAALDNTLGYNNLQNYADSTLGINDYEAYNNSLSSKDIALALQKLWNGSLVNSSDRNLILSYMKEANYREYIVPAIPSEDTIYHKIGLYQDYVNDAAIVTNGNQAFVIVIFTNGNGTYNWPARASLMQQITKAALKAYFNQ